MHEMSFVLMTIDQLEQIIKENKIKKLISVTLDIGESSTIEESYFRTCWESATKDTPLENTKLFINVLPSIGRCLSCGEEFSIKESDHSCPKCHSTSYIPITGKEFEIAQVEAK